jgi:hypothetical protein
MRVQTMQLGVAQCGKDGVGDRAEFSNRLSRDKVMEAERLKIGQIGNGWKGLRLQERWAAWKLAEVLKREYT